MSLDWPEGFDRTPADEREQYPGGFQVSRSKAFDSILAELRKMEARNARIETAAPHTAARPHQPYQDRHPEDPGVVAYFEQDGQQLAAACDRWSSLRDNARAIALYLKAKRAIERYGVATAEGEYATLALPAAGDGAVAGEPPAHEVLGVSPDADTGVIRAAARELKKQHHPDSGGDLAEFKRINRAERKLLEGTS